MPLFVQTHYDIVVVGGGHNGLVAAAYLAKAGLSVLVLERRQHVGGAAVSERMFPGVDARISAYSYLLSLFPQQIIQDLGLQFETRRRSVAAFTPTIRDGRHRALLISNVDPAQTEESFVRLTGSRHEFEAYREFYASAGLFAERVWPSLLEPLITRQEMSRRFDRSEASPEARAIWDMIVEQPLGESVERLFQDDVVRGTVFTDAKIG